MADKTSIEWTRGPDGSPGATWNPIVGCSIVSPGCTNCYAMKMAARIERMGGAPHYDGTTRMSKARDQRLNGAKVSESGGIPIWTGKLALAPDSILLAPLRRRKPTTWFVNSMGDLFHEDVPDEWIDRVFAVMALAPQHTFQVLTKRSARMREYMAGHQSKVPYLGRMPLERIHLEAAGHMVGDGGFMDALKTAGNVYSLYLDAPWPLRNVWLGVSAEDQRRADERVPDLLATPAAVRFVSAEPLLGPIDFNRIDVATWLDRYAKAPRERSEHDPDMRWPLLAPFSHMQSGYSSPGLDQIIVGGESGPGARPMHPDWARSIRDQCAAAGVPFFFKQHGAWAALKANDGEWPADAPGFIRLRCDGTRGEGGWPMQLIGKKAAGRLLDGVEHDAMPARAAS